MPLTRRALLGWVGLGVGAALGGVFRAAGGQRRRPVLLRPPGALDEPEFLAACTRCGQCVEVCPHGSLELAGHNAGVAAGTPFVDPREHPCLLCERQPGLLCIDICPTAALQPVAELSDIRMGTAVIDVETCFAFNGVSCRSCWHTCPFPDKAITFDDLLRPVVHAEHCIGCGICTQACPTSPTSIPIRPRGADRLAEIPGEGDAS